MLWLGLKKSNLVFSLMDCFAQFSIIDRHELLFFHLERVTQIIGLVFLIIVFVYVAFLPNKKMLETGLV
jgi:hypothetical protein